MLYIRPKSRSKGFTLIELLVTIAIIGILAAVVLALLTGSRNKGNDAKVKTEVTQIKTAVEGYAASNGGYPYADRGGSGGTTWCIGASDCMLAGTPVSDNTNGSSYWTGEKDMFPSYTHNIEFKDADQHINKGYIYVSCTAAEAVNGFCPTGTVHISYPLTESEEQITLGNGGNGNGGGGNGGTVSFDGGGNGSSWDDPQNWNPDVVPGVSSAVVIPSGFTYIDGTPPSSIASLTVNGYSAINVTITVTGNSTFNDSSGQNGTITGNVIFNNASVNGGGVFGDTIFNDNSANSGSLANGYQGTFNDESFNGGWISGKAVFNDATHNDYVVEDGATFNDTSVNNGNIYTRHSGTSYLDAIFKNTSANNSNVYGNACFINTVTQNLGTVTGDITVCS